MADGNGARDAESDSLVTYEGATKTFAIPELLEHVLLCLDAKTYYWLSESTLSGEMPSHPARGCRRNCSSCQGHHLMKLCDFTWFNPTRSSTCGKQDHRAISYCRIHCYITTSRLMRCARKTEFQEDLGFVFHGLLRETWPHIGVASLRGSACSPPNHPQSESGPLSHTT